MLGRVKMVDVYFVRFQEEVVAVFPDIQADLQGHCQSYSRVGQHSACDWDYLQQASRPATQQEYLELAQELTSIGYELHIREVENE